MIEQSTYQKTGEAQSDMYKCKWDTCRQTFQNANEFLQHIESHITEKPWICKWRGCKSVRERYTEFRSTLLQHVLYHTSYRPYVCRVQGCTFRTPFKWGLRKHMRVTHHFDSEAEMLNTQISKALQKSNRNSEEPKTISSVRSAKRQKSVFHPQIKPMNEQAYRFGGFSERTASFITANQPLMVSFARPFHSIDPNQLYNTTPVALHQNGCEYETQSLVQKLPSFNRNQNFTYPSNNLPSLSTLMAFDDHYNAVSFIPNSTELILPCTNPLAFAANLSVQNFAQCPSIRNTEPTKDRKTKEETVLPSLSVLFR